MSYPQRPDLRFSWFTDVFSWSIEFEYHKEYRYSYRSASMGSTFEARHAG